MKTSESTKGAADNSEGRRPGTAGTPNPESCKDDQFRQGASPADFICRQQSNVWHRRSSDAIETPHFRQKREFPEIRCPGSAETRGWHNPLPTLHLFEKRRGHQVRTAPVESKGRLAGSGRQTGLPHHRELSFKGAPGPQRPILRQSGLRRMTLFEKSRRIFRQPRKFSGMSRNL